MGDLDAGIVVPFIIATMVVLIVGMDQAKNFFLKKEQIKADALVKVEEIKAKNQLELEKLVRGEKARTNDSRVEFDGDDRKVREKQSL